jgi:glycosyltransferase involved in cell wall biosynthesis
MGEAASPTARVERPLRAAVVGISESETCGVRDHATLLAAGLGRRGVDCSMLWLLRRAGSLRAARAEVGSWARELAVALSQEEHDLVVLHYSVFSYSYRGIPLFVRPALRALRSARSPVISVLHELAYPWELGGARGKLWALSQRALLTGVVRDSDALVVTAPFRADWLASRAWLPRRPTELAPVFSNLPEPSSERARGEPDGRAIGLFGYAYEGAAISLLLDALRLLREREPGARLVLLGAPGPGSPAAQQWLAAARTRGLENALSFSGVLPAQELSDALADCAVLLHAEATGPTSRKGTLVGSLASGRPVVAIDGPLRWAELIESQAALVVEPTAAALAGAVGGLLADEQRRERLGERGREFARSTMGVERSAEAVLSALARVDADAVPRPR